MASGPDNGPPTEMAAFIAHEIAGALAAIVNNAAAAELMLARDTPELDEARAVARAIYADAMRAADIVRGVRALLSPGTPEAAPLDLRVVVQAAVGLLRMRAVDAGVDFLVAPENVPLVRGDARQLQQLVLNLCRNAIDAMAGHQGQRQLLVRTTTAAGRACIEVSDTGPGFSQEALEHASDLFFTTKRRNGGMGVGLALVRRIADAHSGTLHIANRPRSGACVTLTLPAEGCGEAQSLTEVTAREKATVLRMVVQKDRLAPSA
jgi:signal transduction histidine kinase